MTALVLIPLVVLLIALVFGYFLPRRRRRSKRAGPIALAPFGRADATAIPPRPTRAAPAPAPAWAGEAASANRPQAVAPQPQVGVQPNVQPDVEQQPVQARAAEAAEDAMEEHGRVLRLQVAGDRRDVLRDDGRAAATLRLERTVDGTLQFLPGRLEVLESKDMAGQELRFVRTPGPDGTSVTFGRSTGPAYRHVQFAEPTVSRMHAKMSLDGKTWSLHNLSATNPVVVNGLPLAGQGSSVVLREGDRIEMGEVILRFRAK